MHGPFLGLPIYSFKHTFRMFSLIFLQLSFTSITGIYLKSNKIMLIILLFTKNMYYRTYLFLFFSNKHHYYRAFVKDLIPYANMNSYFLSIYLKSYYCSYSMTITVPFSTPLYFVFTSNNCMNSSYRVHTFVSYFILGITTKQFRNSKCGHLYKFTQIKTAPHKEISYNDQGILKMCAWVLVRVI